MKRSYIIAFVVTLLGADALAQTAPMARRSKQFDGTTAVRGGRGTQGHGPILRDAFWSEDFSGGGLPANWLTTDDSTAAAEPVIFEWSNDPAAVGAASLGNTAYSTFLAPGASNGYLWANSDRGLTAAPATNHMTRLTTAPIDCSEQASIMFSMQSVIGVFDLDASENVWLRVSTDGINWSEAYLPYPDLVTGASNPPNVRWSYNPQQVYIDISAEAAFEPEVYLQLEWRGGWEYYWAIDDMALSPLPDYEIGMGNAFISTYEALGLDGSSEGWVEYGLIPASQLEETMTVGASVYNFGLGEQTGIELHVTFEDADGNPVPGFSGSFPVDMLMHGDTVDVVGVIDVPAGLATGHYTARFTLTGDFVDLDVLNPDDNEASRHVEVTTDEYAMDGLGSHPDGEQSTDYIATWNIVDYNEFHAMTLYNVTSPMTVTGLYVTLNTDSVRLVANDETGALTVPGDEAELEGFIYADVAAVQANEVGMPDPINSAYQGARSAIHTIVDADVEAGRVGLVFDPPVVLPPGTYYAGVRMKGSGTLAPGLMDDPEVAIMDDTTVPQPWFASVVYVPNFPGRPVGSDGNAWAIRMTSSPSIGIREVSELTGISLYPNPTDGVFQIASDRTEVLFVEVTDAMGRIVHTSNFSNMTSIDLSKVAAGVYNVEVSSRNARSVHRVMVN